MAVLAARKMAAMVAAVCFVLVIAVAVTGQPTPECSACCAAKCASCSDPAAVCAPTCARFPPSACESCKRQVAQICASRCFEPCYANCTSTGC